VTRPRAAHRLSDAAGRPIRSGADRVELAAGRGASRRLPDLGAAQIVSHELPLDQAPTAYEKFDKRVEGYTKVVLHPQG
jgi:hypothetical protein